MLDPGIAHPGLGALAPAVEQVQDAPAVGLMGLVMGEDDGQGSINLN
jgi:hypothetical protein